MIGSKIEQVMVCFAQKLLNGITNPLPTLVFHMIQNTLDLCSKVKWQRNKFVINFLIKYTPLFANYLQKYTPLFSNPNLYKKKSYSLQGRKTSGLLCVMTKNVWMNAKTAKSLICGEKGLTLSILFSNYGFW